MLRQNLEFLEKTGLEILKRALERPLRQLAESAGLDGAVVAEKVKRGESLADPLGVSGYFPPLLVQITAIGEETGKLDEMLLNAAETFDTEADSALNKFMAIFPALLILVLAVVIGFIIVATLLPIVTMQLAGGMG